MDDTGGRVGDEGLACALESSVQVLRQSLVGNGKRRDERTVLASVIVSAKLGIPFDASSNNAFGLKMTEVLRKRFTKASKDLMHQYSARKMRTRLTCNRGEIGCSIDLHEVDRADHLLEQ